MINKENQHLIKTLNKLGRSYLNGVFSHYENDENFNLSMNLVFYNSKDGSNKTVAKILTNRKATKKTIHKLNKEYNQLIIKFLYEHFKNSL